MPKSLALLALACSALAGLTLAPRPASAQDSGVTAAAAPKDQGPRERPIFDSPMFLDLSTGVIHYQNEVENGETRFLIGPVFNWNFAATRPVQTPVQYGLATGLLYTHLGARGSSFFGTNPPAGVAGSGANLFLIPLDLWGGYELGPDRQGFAALHVGSNLYLRSTAGAMRLGRENNPSEGSADFFPSLGFSLAWPIDRDVALRFRADWTLAPEDGVFSATLGATIPMS